MPLPTSDFHQPVCMEMKTMNTDPERYTIYKENVRAISNNNSVSKRITKFGMESLECSKGESEKFISCEGAVKTFEENKNEMGGSVDSSDTFASCNTHPFQSEGDLTSDVINQSCAIFDYVLDNSSNLYVNPLDLPLDESSNVLLGLKKSASGDTALRSLVNSTTDNLIGNIGRSPERGSRGSLNYVSVPKHRKTRFQQVSWCFIYSRGVWGEGGRGKRYNSIIV